MQRILMSCLTLNKGLYYYNDELFTGIGFEVKGSEVKQRIVIKDGLQSGPYLNEYMPTLEHCLHVNEDALEPHPSNYDGQPVSYQNKPFTGIAYEFWKDFCTSETLRVNGYWDHGRWDNAVITYYISGCFESVYISSDGLHQKYEWNPEGNLKTLMLLKKGFLEIDIECTEDLNLKKVMIGQDYFKNIDLLKNRLKFPVYDNKQFADGLSSS